MGLWNRYAVPAIVSCACATKPAMRQRAKIVPAAAGEVLELGCGSGTNFAFYDPSRVTRLHAVEPAPGMVTRARAAAAQTAVADRVRFHQTGAENLPMEDASIDTAVITFVLCTIPDWRGALREVRRVLKPGGRVLFSEHGLAPDADVARRQHRFEPVWKRLLGGCHLTRSPADMLAAGGFRVERIETMYLPSTPRIAGFASWGTAVPA
ncbi:class I SAM-dependent methyltransferase [Sphingosinicella soli]|uniref:Ubiquinone/menaquinone biosynthesis C-methylase UbiE n=1 Tax=Sphingosinicella soli TaxID=333708 RepID=A0A7W7AZU9_9SPHN|nr:class I SAM-dependent methyltransferase [Sphingosinicella soli]MBB4631421.1 ubiquinone/menaquinone biosynthesis C-methylase UbiE [Sphingosinicella soli]